LPQWVAARLGRNHVVTQSHNLAMSLAVGLVGLVDERCNLSKAPIPAWAEQQAGMASPVVRVTWLTRTWPGGVCVAQDTCDTGDVGTEASDEPQMEPRRASLPSMRKARALSFHLGHSFLEVIRRTKSTELPDASGVLPEGDGTSPPDAAASAEASIPQTILRFARKWRRSTTIREEPEAEPEGSFRVGAWRRKSQVRRTSIAIDPKLEVRTFR
jgi:hypothetical protein